MSIAVATPITGFASVPWIDRGFSEEARLLRDWTVEVTKFSRSIVLEKPRRELQDALDAACVAAQEPNWDGMGSAPVEPSTYTYASQFLQIFPANALPPDISVDTDGELLFEWDRGPRQTFSVSVGRDGTLTFAGLLGYRKVHGTEHFREALPLVIADWIQDVTARATNGANG